MRATYAFFDGGNRADCAASACVIYEGREEVASAADFYDEAGLTSNVCEWRGLILALEQALRIGAREITVYGDSELIVRQFNGRYAVHAHHLRPYFDRAHELAALFAHAEVREAPRAGRDMRRRSSNVYADSLCRLAMDSRSSFRK